MRLTEISIQDYRSFVISSVIGGKLERCLTLNSTCIPPNDVFETCLVNSESRLLDCSLGSVSVQCNCEWCKEVPTIWRAADCRKDDYSTHSTQTRLELIATRRHLVLNYRTEEVSSGVCQQNACLHLRRWKYLLFRTGLCRTPDDIFSSLRRMPARE